MLLCCGGSVSAVCTDLGIQDSIIDNFAHLREMPSIPFSDSHGVGVELLVQLVEQGDGLKGAEVHTHTMSSQINSTSTAKNKKRQYLLCERT